MLKPIRNFVKKYCPTWASIAYIGFIFAIIVHIVSKNSVAFSDFYNRYIGSVLRAVLAYITNIFPFSIAEAVIICLPVLMILLIWGGIRATKKGSVASTRYLCGLFACVTLFYTLFWGGFAVGYNSSTLEDKLGLDRREVTAAELLQTASILLDESNKLANDVDFKYASSSVMPYSYAEMNKKLNEAYKKVCEKYTFIAPMYSNVKTVMLSEPMTYTHISGVYTYYTGEANINVNFPDYTLPYTAAHELSHQRGIAREDEANFMAFLVCLESDDAYIRYSGYMNLFEYVVNALYSANKNMYYALMNNADNRIRYEMFAYNEFFEKYRESVASEVSGTVNDNYLKAQGQTDGTKSYGRVVDLAVAYYIPHKGVDMNG